MYISGGGVASHSFGEIASLPKIHMAWLVCVFWKELKDLRNYLSEYQKDVLVYFLEKNPMLTSIPFSNKYEREKTCFSYVRI